MSTELRRVTYGNHGVARLTPAPDKPGTYMGMPKFSKAVKGELNLSVQRKNMRCHHDDSQQARHACLRIPGLAGSA